MESLRRPRGLSIATALAVLGVSFGALLASTPHAAAVTYVRGTIAVDTTWGIADNEYVLTAHVTVAPGVTLTILPGTTVKFDPGRALFVEGELWADGFPGGEILFLANNTIALFPPMGIQFNASARGSVSWSFFERMERAVTAIDSSPSVTNNLVAWATYGFAFVRSASVCTDNAVLRAYLGVYLSESDATVMRNYLNNTNTGVQAFFSGSPSIAQNTIVNTSGFVALGIHVTGGAVADVRDNVIAGVQGARGGNGVGSGAAGFDGGLAVGILVDTAPSARVDGNTVTWVGGGQGGNGVDNTGGTGGRGGNGGNAAGIVLGNIPTANVDNNAISQIYGGRGGNGGGSGTTALGGAGGDAGDAAGIEVLGTTAATRWLGNWIDGINGGVGGNGGAGVGDGYGGVGGEALGILGLGAANGDASGNTVQNLRGGPGGNSTALGAGDAAGGDGGAASGIGLIGDVGSLTIHTNGITALTGGNGGRGATGGRGGNATGAAVLGDNDGVYSSTSITSNWIQDVAAGNGAIGGRIGGLGGAAGGITIALVSPYLAWNFIWNTVGGDGGDAIDGNDGGRGGDAGGVYAYAVPSGWSAQDTIVTVSKGAAGLGPPVQASYAAGFAMEGDATRKTAFTMENASIANVDTYDMWASAYADGTTINTPFDPAKLAVAVTSTLTVKNYLDTSVFWPDGFTPVAGASVLVAEDGATVWNFVSATGMDPWLLTTDRVYKNSVIPTDVRNDVTVSYLVYAFANNPRTVDMASSGSEAFVMLDSDAPTSTAAPLPTYSTVFTFTVSYTASDGTGEGLSTITLWYRKDGGAWTAYATQPAGNGGSFGFTATSDGTYEFETVADDLAGNVEPGPGTVEASTIVDTTRPASIVAPQPTWRNTLLFQVFWGPDGGTTDIVTYTIQYNRGFGWNNWLTDVTQTSGWFLATTNSVYQFRSIAKDGAGNVEVVSGNDTWTIVDTQKPFAFVLELPPWQTALSFLVQWAPESDDVASYNIQVRDDGGAWTDWILSTIATSGTFTGVDGHTYEYRAIATDYAGNVQNPNPNNDTWTRVDVTLPQSSMVGLPAWATLLTFSIAWGPAGGTADIATYTVQSSDNGGAWTNVPGYVDTTAATGSFTGIDGHAYAFRSIARDQAGNVESTSPANDTWTIVDATPPTSGGTPSGTLGAGGWWVSAVTVTLTSTDATSGVFEVHYQIDGGAHQTYAAPFAVGGDGAHTVVYHAHDNAGLTEPDRFLPFDIDVTPPVTSASLFGVTGDNGWHTGPVTVTLTATDATSGAASTSYRLDGGSWQPYAGQIGVTADGPHTVEYYSTDSAGRVETMNTVTFKIDSAEPFVTNTEPRGAGTNLTPLIVVTFNEPMNTASVEGSFAIQPDMNGVFSWSTDNRTMTFVPDRALQPGREYFVAVGTNAKDVAGNGLPLTATFSFTTAAATPPPSGGGSGDWLWIIAVVAAGLGGTLFIAMRRLGVRAKPVPAVPAKKESQATIDDVFLLYRDGLLIKHETRRLKPDIDTDILSGMLTAVQSFVKDSFRSEEGELDELTFGEMHILIGRGHWLILAAMVQGDGTDNMRPQIEACILDMETAHPELIEKWDGNMTIAKTLSPFIKKLIRGEYASGAPPNV